MDAVLGGTLLLVLTILAIMVLVLWFFLPFIILGTNRRLDTIVELLKKSEKSGEV
jgi:sensor domain CHASE-containing protein